jgi:hypothetical protein
MDYHGFLQQLFEEMFNKSHLTYKYGCKLNHQTGLLEENVFGTCFHCNGYIGVITKSWMDPSAIWPEREWITWLNLPFADINRCMVFLVDSAQPPQFISNVQNYNIYTSNVTGNLIPIVRLFRGGLWANRSDKDNIEIGLKNIAKTFELTVIKNY